MPDSQFPSGDEPSMRIAPHLTLEQTKLTSTESDAVDSEEASPVDVDACEPVDAPGPPSEPVRLENDRASQRSYRTVLFLALAAALLVSLLVNEAQNEAQNAQQTNRDGPPAVMGSGLVDPR